MRTAPKQKAIIGWRETILLRDLSEIPINVKIDTGARTSALHAFNLRIKDDNGIAMAEFTLQPIQRSGAGASRVRLPIRSMRKIRSSNGRSETRPTVMANATLGETTWPIEITLTSRDQMGFRMLLGRSAVKSRFVIDPSRSYLLSDKPTKQGHS
jgi:hypothetical protein